MTVFVRSFNGVGTGASATVYTAETNAPIQMKRWCLNNTTAGALAVTIVFNDGATDRTVMNAYPVAGANAEPYTPEALNGSIIPAGGSVKIDAPAGITYWVSYVAVIQ